MHILKYILVTFTVVFYSCTSISDNYLKTLDLPIYNITPVDSINIDTYDFFQSHDVIKIDENWLVTSSTSGKYNLLFLNINNGEHFYAIRRGRGPGEVIIGNSFHKYGNDAIYHDSNSSTCMKIRLRESVERHAVVIDTIGRFSSSNIRPVYLAANDDGVISGNVADYKSWYCFYDFEGNIISSAEQLHYDQLLQSPDFCASVHLSTMYAFNSSGTKVCVASVVSPSLAFAEVNNGKLDEFMRYEISAPVPGAENISAFNDIFATDEYVYLLYSGRKLRGGNIPAHECNHIVVYDWEGNPVRHYELNNNISSIHVDNNTLIATSTHPESCVYQFNL